MTGPFSLLDGHEQIVYGSDPEAGLQCIIAIHSTVLGPALGGTRFHAYETEEQALADVLRLSKAMAYKAACAGLDLGGGKAVIIGDPALDKTEQLLRAYGRIVESLGGRYVTACDVGTYPADMSVVRRETTWATGAEIAAGGSGDSGVSTAVGVFIGMQACLERVFGATSVAGRHIAIQGVGKVGRRLAEHLAREGAKLSVADVDPAAAEWCAERFGAEIVNIDKIHAVDADVFSPNALGGAINPTTRAELLCRIVAGAANNQLLTHEDGEALAERGILYAPDYVINSGGLIQVSDELGPGGYSPARAQQKVEQIADRLREVFDVAERERLSTTAAADHIAERRVAALGRIRGFWLPSTS
ncbi:MAG TPA: Glu/Leu/Phe/Val dehydrogenase dimerization domain-containing protein [Egibacteraceae bacterium]|nr:Glu/Leu/Phe/Val dehydrogenase dimerization domain-containing protein [Egibacteraceae bacterium]